MINKRKYLGKNPDELGVKDAIHVAIVSCVAGSAIKRGGRVTLNDNGHAEMCDVGGFGVADPFIGDIARGEKFWVMMYPDSIASVAHAWEHPVEFPTAPAVVPKNKYLEKYAVILGVTYEYLMQACSSYVKTDRKSPYPGTLPENTVDELVNEQIELGDMWYEWSNETGYEFSNEGTECCPEYSYPDDIPFEWV